MAYISRQALGALRNYRYNGVDKCVAPVTSLLGTYKARAKPDSPKRSFLSNNVLNPFWTWFVTLWPEWVAPNMVRKSPLYFFTSRRQIKRVGGRSRCPGSRLYCLILRRYRSMIQRTSHKKEVRQAPQIGCILRASLGSSPLICLRAALSYLMLTWRPSDGALDCSCIRRLTR
jgi:hypothetical protein